MKPKKKGRGIYCFFAPQLTEVTRRRQKLDKDLASRMLRAANLFCITNRWSQSVQGASQGLRRCCAGITPEEGADPSGRVHTTAGRAGVDGGSGELGSKEGLPSKRGLAKRRTSEGSGVR